MKIKVKVKPNARENSIKELEKGYFEVKVSVQPEKGKANKKEIELENESSEEIWARESFFVMRRAGGPNKVLPPFTYEIAARQKSLIPEDRNIQNSITRTTSWVSVNPTGMFYNVTGNNYISGRTNSIAFHPADPNIMYIAAAQGGVWKTTNGGLNWVPLTDNL